MHTPINKILRYMQTPPQGCGAALALRPLPRIAPQSSYHAAPMRAQHTHLQGCGAALALRPLPRIALQSSCHAGRGGVGCAGCPWRRIKKRLGGRAFARLRGGCPACAPRFACAPPPLVPLLRIITTHLYFLKLVSSSVLKLVSYSISNRGAFGLPLGVVLGLGVWWGVWVVVRCGVRAVA